MNRRRTVASVLLILGAVGVFIGLPREQAPAASPAPAPAPASETPATLQPHEPRPAADEAPAIGQAPGPTGTLTVQVRDSAGLPAAKAEVRCSNAQNFMPEVTDSNGIATLELVAGEWNIQVIHRSSAAPLSTVSIEPGRTHALEIALGAPKRLAGVVLDGLGNPQPAVLISLSDAESAAVLEPTLSGSDGRFVAEVTANALHVGVFDPRYAMWRRRVAVPEDKLRIVLGTPVALSVRTVDAQGKDVLDARLEISAGNFLMDLTSRPAFRQLRLHPGPVRLRALRRAQGGPLERAEAGLELRLAAEHVTLTLRPASGLVGTVIDPHGVPLANATVVALEVSRTLRAVTDAQRASGLTTVAASDALGTTGADGRFELAPRAVTAPGSLYRLHVLGNGVREPPEMILQQLGGTPVEIRLQSN